MRSRLPRVKSVGQDAEEVGLPTPSTLALALVAQDSQLGVRGSGESAARLGLARSRPLATLP